MSAIHVFNHISLDGFFAGAGGEIDWFHSVPKDEEFDTYIHRQSKGGSTLLFGRTTYEMMKSYWPTPEAKQADPGMASAMNDSPKVVFSTTLDANEGRGWNVTVARDIDRDAILRLKAQRPITILGSGTIVQQLTNLGLIDEYQLLLVPVVIGKGKPLFAGVQKTQLVLKSAQSFKNGIVVLKYAPSR